MKNKRLKLFFQFILLTPVIMCLSPYGHSQRVQIEIRPPQTTYWNPLHHTDCGCRVVKNWVFPNTQAAEQTWKQYVDCEWQAHPEYQDSEAADVHPIDFEVVDHQDNEDIDPFFEDWSVASPENASSENSQNAQTTASTPFEAKNGTTSWKYDDGTTAYQVGVPSYVEAAMGLAIVAHRIASSPYLPGRFQKAQTRQYLSNLEDFRAVMDQNRGTISLINTQMEKDISEFVSQTSILLDHAQRVHLPPIAESIAKLEEKIQQSSEQIPALENFIQKESASFVPSLAEASLIDPTEGEYLEKIQTERQAIRLEIDHGQFEAALTQINQIQDALESFPADTAQSPTVSNHIFRERALLEEFVNDQGIIRFLSMPSEAAALNTLVSDPTSILGKKIRREINRGLVSWHTNHNAEDRAQLLSAFAFLSAADVAEYAKDVDSSFKNLKVAGMLLDTVLGLIPVVSTANDFSNILHGLVTGYDLFGNRMLSTDYALRAFSAVAGLVGAGQLIKFLQVPITQSFTAGASLIRKFNAGKTLANATSHLSTKTKVITDLGEFASSRSVRNQTIRDGADALTKMTPQQFESVITKSAQTIDKLQYSTNGDDLYRLIPTKSQEQLNRAKAIIQEQTFLTQSFKSRPDAFFKDNRFGKAISFTQTPDAAIREVFLDDIPDWINSKSHVLLKTTVKTGDINSVIIAPSAEVLGEIAVHIKDNPTTIFADIQAISGHADIVKELGL